MITYSRVIMVIVLLFHCLATEVQANNDNTIKIYTEVFPPYQLVNSESGELIGWSTNIVKSTFDHANIDYDIEVFPWARAYNAAQKDPNTFIFSMLKTAQRTQKFIWVLPLCAMQFSLYQDKSKPRIVANSIEDIQQYVVGVSRNQAGESFLTGNGFLRNKNLVIVNNNEQLRKMLLKQRVDLILASDTFISNLQSNKDVTAMQISPAFKVKELQLQMYLAASLNTDQQIIDKLVHAHNTLNLQLSSECTGQ